MGKSLQNMTDEGFLAWSENFKLRIAQMGQSITGLSAAQTTDYADKHSAFAAALQLAKEPITRTPPAIANKRDARSTLQLLARQFISIINGQPDLTEAQRLELGINVRKKPTPIPVPDSSPSIDVLWAQDRTIAVRIHDSESSDKNTRPAGARGVALYSYAGNNPPPVGSIDWRFEGNTSKRVVEVDFPDTVPNGSTVWFRAFYIGSRLESGPVSEAVSAVLPGSVGEPTAAMKMAA